MASFSKADYFRVHQIGQELWTKSSNQQVRAWALELMDMAEGVLGQLHRPRGAGPLPESIRAILPTSDEAPGDV